MRECADRLDQERPRHPRGEQGGADRRADELSAGEKAGHESGVADAEVLVGDDHRQQRAGGRVGEHLRGPQERHRTEHDGDAHRSGQQRYGQQAQDRGAQQIAGHDDALPVDAVGQHPGIQAEQQPGQALEQTRQRHEQRVPGLRSDQQRAGREPHSVAEVADPRRTDQPAKRGAHPSGQHSFKQPSHNAGP
jgi:hypothetical protein